MSQFRILKSARNAESYSAVDLIIYFALLRVNLSGIGETDAIRKIFVTTIGSHVRLMDVIEA